MNYTENCRLPQWEETDWVLRTDFNDAFAALEVIGTDHAKLRSLAGDLARDAYRREIQGRVCHGRGGVTNSMWVNALASREDAGGDGHGWSGRYGVRLGPGNLPDWDCVSASAKEESYICIGYDHLPTNAAAAVTFTSDAYGILESINIWSEMHPTFASSAKEYPFTITMTRLDTGESTQSPVFMSQSAPGYQRITAYEVNYPLEAGVSYRFAYEMPEPYTLFGKGGFVLASSQFYSITGPQMEFAERGANQVPDAAASAPDGSRGATGIVRWRGNGTVALLLNDVLMAKSQEREGFTAEGEPCMETEFRLDPLPEGPLTVRLAWTKKEGDFSVFDYGLIWE